MQLIEPIAAKEMMMTVWRNSMLLALAVCGLMASSTAATSVTLHEATMGQVGHLPVGISFFASAQDEPILIEAAFAFEQLSKQRFAPVLLPSSN